MPLDIDHSEAHPCYRIVQHPLGDTWPKRSINQLREWRDSAAGAKIMMARGLLIFPALLFGFVAEKLMGGMGEGTTIIFGILMGIGLLTPALLHLLFLGAWSVLSFLHVVVLGIRRVNRPRGDWEFLRLRVRPMEIEIHGRRREPHCYVDQCFPLVARSESLSRLSFELMPSTGPLSVLQIRPLDGPTWIFPDLVLTLQEFQSFHEVLTDAIQQAVERHGLGPSEVPEEIKRLQQRGPTEPEA